MTAEPSLAFFFVVALAAIARASRLLISRLSCVREPMSMVSDVLLMDMGLVRMGRYNLFSSFRFFDTLSDGTGLGEDLALDADLSSSLSVLRSPIVSSALL